MSKEKEKPSAIKRTIAAALIVKEIATGTPTPEEVKIPQQQSSCVQAELRAASSANQSQTLEDRNQQQREAGFKKQMQEAKAYGQVQAVEREQRKAELNTAIDAEANRQTTSSSKIQSSLNEQKGSSGQETKTEAREAGKEAANTQQQQQTR